MVHWGFLILAFVVGFISGCVVLIYLARLAARIKSAIQEATKKM